MIKFYLILKTIFFFLLLGQSGGSSSAGSAWSKKPMLTSSTVTQVFHIPVEERKDQVTGDFGSASMDSSHKNIKYGTYLLHDFSYKNIKNVTVPNNSYRF